MQLSQSILITLASLLAATKAEDLVVALVSDIHDHESDWLDFVQVSTHRDDFSVLGPFFTFYEQAVTYTDDSYTTLIGDVERASVENLATNLPWYSSRIEPALNAGATPTTVSSSSAPTTETSSDASTSTSASPSPAPTTESSSAAPTSDSAAPAKSSETVSKGDESKSGSSVSTSSVPASHSVFSAGAALGPYAAPGAALGLAFGVVAML